MGSEVNRNLPIDNSIWVGLGLIDILLFLSIRPGIWEVNIYREEAFMGKIILQEGKILEVCFKNTEKNSIVSLLKMKDVTFIVRRLKYFKEIKTEIFIEDVFKDYIKKNKLYFKYLRKKRNNLYKKRWN